MTRVFDPNPGPKAKAWRQQLTDMPPVATPDDYLDDYPPENGVWTAQDESQRLVDLGDKHADDPAPHTLKDLTREQRDSESAFRKGWITESARRSAVRLRLVLKDLDTDSDLDSYARRNLPSHLKQVIERLEHDVEKVTSDTPIYQTVEELDRIAGL